MTTTLIVLAHPDNRSFNGAWADATEAAALEHGGSVLRSDLCAMNFNPVEAPKSYRQAEKGVRFDPLKAQESAAKEDKFPPDVRAEIEKLQAADRVVFHFPLWWFSVPAILKGWLDRVLVHGALHSVDERFDNGKFRSKKALFCVTTGASEAESAFNGKEGEAEMLLWPAAYTLRYLGFTVLTPKIVHGVHGYHTGPARVELENRLKAVLGEQDELIEGFDSRPCLSFNKDTDFDENGSLLPDRPSHSFFIRQSKS